ncbi:MAG: HlyC/CorC family transporter [Synechococcales cyanobacterium CRU_2_2]|nr:HlyC/CorC family transporter [Synechococcales cyanobacterium CRU_2_2]
MTLVETAERFAAVMALILLNAFFVAAEFSVLSVRQSRINQLVQEGDANARTVQRLQQGMERLLSATQIGITLSSLALGWIGENTVGASVSLALARLPIEATFKQQLIHAIALPIAFFWVAYMQIVLGELCPKALALLYPEQMARSLGPFSWSIARFFKPLVLLLNQSTRILLRLVGIRYDQEIAPARLSSKELQLIITTQSASGLQADERRLLSNVLEFSSLSASDIMVPRPDAETLPATLTLQDLLSAVQSTGHSRFPVVEDSIDNIIGLIQLKALSASLLEGSIGLETALRPWVYPVQFVPEHMPLPELRTLMQQNQSEAVIVVDEYGGTAGLITLADVVSELLDVREQMGTQADAEIQQLDPFTYQIQAQVNLEDVNEQLGFAFPLSEDYTTLGGFLINLLQQVPEPGQVATYQDLEIEVISSEDRRLNLLQVRQRPARSDPSSPTGTDRQVPFDESAS